MSDVPDVAEAEVRLGLHDPVPPPGGGRASAGRGQGGRLLLLPLPLLIARQGAAAPARTHPLSPQVTRGCDFAFFEKIEKVESKTDVKYKS